MIICIHEFIRIHILHRKFMIKTRVHCFESTQCLDRSRFYWEFRYTRNTCLICRFQVSTINRPTLCAHQDVSCENIPKRKKSRWRTHVTSLCISTLSKAQEPQIFYKISHQFIGRKSNKNSNVKLLGVHAVLQIWRKWSRKHKLGFEIFRPRWISCTSRSNSCTAQNTSTDYIYFSLDLTLLVILKREWNEPFKKVQSCNRYSSLHCQGLRL